MIESFDVIARTVEHVPLKRRRDLLRKLELCINGPLHDGPSRRGFVHGAVVPDTTKCQRCHDRHNGRPTP